MGRPPYLGLDGIPTLSLSLACTAATDVVPESDVRAGLHDDAPDRTSGVQDAAVDEVEVELWWAGLPGDVRQGLLDVGTEPIPVWYLANIPRGWLATIDAAFDATTGAPPITLEMLDPALRDFLARKAVEPLS